MLTIAISPILGMRMVTAQQSFGRCEVDTSVMFSPCLASTKVLPEFPPLGPGPPSCLAVMM